MVCANYFPTLSAPQKDEAFRHTLGELEKREFQLLSRLNKQLLKAPQRQEPEPDVRLRELKNRMTRRFEEVIQAKGVFELSNEEYYSSSRHFPLKAGYTKEDDEFIVQMRKYGIEKFDQHCADDDDAGTASNFQKAAAFKQLPIEYLIELLTIDREQLHAENMEKIGGIKRAFFHEDGDKLLAEREALDQENLLKDLEFLTSAENDFLNYLEQRQQQNLALMNMDLYEDEKPGNNSMVIEISPRKPESREPGNDTLEVVINNDEEDVSISLEVARPGPSQEGAQEPAGAQAKKEHVAGHPQQTSKVPRPLKDDIVCQVCNDGDYSEENMIVFCSVPSSHK